MFNILNIWKPVGIFGAIAAALLLAWGLRVSSLNDAKNELLKLILPAAREATGNPDLERANIPGALKILADEKRAVVVAVNRALPDADNDIDYVQRVTWDNAAEQIDQIGSARRSIRIELNNNNKRIDKMARELVAAKADRDRLRAIYKQAQAMRDAAAEKLSDMHLTPEEEANCLLADRTAREAQNIIRSVLCVEPAC